MPGRIAMPRGSDAIRRAALQDLRATLAAIRKAISVLDPSCLPPIARSVGNEISRASARAERAVARLERDFAGQRRPE